ncbi:unnamed protein product [Nezara viridula]|uniref:Innexin n=1 Tax=Nezara viridula TaxID=85310 RepID=A0A9P0HJK6_NEZVI|nr:unnamed protein product [Nezara viridula]
MFIFGGFTKKVKLRPSDVSIDNFLSKLHYRFTFALLLACTVLLSSKQFIKQHIQCIRDKGEKGGVVDDAIGTFCFISSTFTVNKYHNSSYRPGVHVAQSGVGPEQPGDELTYHAYYQWVPFVLFGQALLFYLPHYLWKSLENGRIKAIVSQVKTSIYTAEEDTVISGYKIDSHETRQNREKLFNDIFITWARMKMNRDWARNFIMCEMLYIVNILLQIQLIDRFLQGNFLNLGMRWIRNEKEALESVFPKITKCSFNKYGYAGSVQNLDILCVLPLNIINEKIYTLLWFWFLILLVFTTLGTVWRVLSFLLHNNGAFNRLVWAEVSPGPALKAAEIEMISNKLSFSDWFFIYYIGKNMDSRMFRRVVADLGLSLSLGKHLKPIIESEKSKLNSESYC